MIGNKNYDIYIIPYVKAFRKTKTVQFFDHMKAFDDFFRSISFISNLILERRHHKVLTSIDIIHSALLLPS